MKRWPFAILVVVLLAFGAVAAKSMGGGDDDHHGGRLPAVEKGIPVDYRILYEITTPDGTTTEEHVVHRPFGAEVVQRDTDGKITAERWSALGELVTRSQGAEAVRLDSAIATSASDSRPDVFVGPLLKVKRLTKGGATEIGGRPCTETSQPQTVQTEGDGTSKDSSLRVTITQCADKQGLVLEERWTSPGGRTLLTKRAVELELGKDVPAIEIPKAERLPQEQGNGAVKKIAEDHAVPFAETFHLPSPKGWTYVGRYAVVPARLAQGSAALPAKASIALYTDVWRKGPDLLLLDQGANNLGPPPFDASTKLGSFEFPGLGVADLAVDLRIAEVRFTRLHAGFARLAGTIDPKELVALAGTITVQDTPR